MTKILPGLLLSLLMLGCSTPPGAPPRAADTATAQKLFAQPPREYSTAPLWVWNDLLTEQQVRETMRDLASQQVKQVFIHPRPGRMTPYLSPDWFRLWKVALDEAERLDMNCWIYDENSYPSGFAGGWVPELMPESRGRGLQLRLETQALTWETNTLAVFRLDTEKFMDVSVEARAGKLPPRGRYFIATIMRAQNRGWTAGRCYVDLMLPGVTKKFLDVTLEAYQREVGDQFGKRIPGSFTDEPEVRPAGGLPWTDDLPQQFQQRWGYSLLENLPCLNQEVGDWRKVRHDYFRLCNALFIERWAKPYYEWCAQHNLKFTGHYWDHDWPNCGGVPNNMAMAAWQQQPGIDCLMNQYREGTHAQFGNVRMVRELGSVANQLGRTRTLCEIYGAGGWDLRFEDMKRIGDWLGVLGVNLFDEHLSYVTLRGARKRDHPQSFSYHEPWWEAYHVNAGYLARLSCALAQGRQVNRVLVLEPTTTAWMYQGNVARLTQIGDEFCNLLMALEAAQVEYDIGDEDILARNGSLKDGELVSGQRQYATVVLPPGVENLDGATVKLLENFRGTLLRCGEAVARVDGAASTSAAALGKKVDAAALPGLLKTEGFAIARKTGDKGILFHQRRQLDDGQLLFLVNTSSEQPSAGTIEAAVGGVEQWDLNTGKPRSYPFEKSAAGVKAAFTLPPSGSLLLFLPQQARAPVATPQEQVTTFAIKGALVGHRIAPNVLTLDYVDITAGGETKQNIYFYEANQFAFQKNGFERNPWDSAVQFKDELIVKKLTNNPGFEASYRFIIAEKVPANLAIVIERPDLYSVTCNGRPISAKAGDWWLDKAFGRIALAQIARVGENIVTIKAAPFTIFHEIEPAYVLGDFALKPAAAGFVIVPDQPLQLGKWNEQGQPFYSAGVAYRAACELRAPAGRYAVALPAWYGSVAKVSINGKVVGYIAAPPWECDVTEHLKPGANTIEVTVIGTLKNTLGPHHGKQPLGSA
ncbi:MAG: glycosyl hydrolase, partial [Kiritimatiellaeota bacterium]|nr:glycosyl hydrolase [Kiritimatiellota bacterium]